MPEKKDYDDELVQLLGRGELSNRQIAKRLGLSFTFISSIARGENRPELQPKILAAMRQTLKVAWKNGGRLASDSGQRAPGATPATPTATAHAGFDRHLAVELIAAGQLTLSQIARRLGIHKTAAWRIATGRSHPELQPLIREAQQHYRSRARRIGVKWSAQIVMKQIQVGLKNNGWVGLRARQDLLDRFLGPEDDGVENEVPPAERDFGPELRDLPDPLKSQVIEALGGPGPEEGEEEYVYCNDPSTWKPAGAAAEQYAKEQAAAEPFDAPQGKQEQAKPHPPSAEPFDAPQGKQEQAKPHPPSAEPGELPPTPRLRRTSQGKQEQTTEQEQSPPPEEGCSRSKKRRWRERRKRQQRLLTADLSPPRGPGGVGSPQTCPPLGAQGAWGERRENRTFSGGPLVSAKARAEAGYGPRGSFPHSETCPANPEASAKAEVYRRACPATCPGEALAEPEALRSPPKPWRRRGEGGAKAG